MCDNSVFIQGHKKQVDLLLTESPYTQQSLAVLYFIDAESQPLHSCFLHPFMKASDL